MEWSVERLGAIERWTILGESRRNSLSGALLRELLEHQARVRSEEITKANGTREKLLAYWQAAGIEVPEFRWPTTPTTLSRNSAV